MKDLTIEQFVRENLPEHEQRIRAFRVVDDNMEVLIDPNIPHYEEFIKGRFIKNHFPEALAAYSERLCREQREICVKEFWAEVEQDVSHKAFAEAILDAPSPSFKTE